MRRLLGDDIDRELRPLLLSVMLGFAGVFSFVAFFAVWAVAELDVPAGQVGLAFTGAAAAGCVGALLGGHLSDRIGRKPVIVSAAAAQTVVSALLLAPVGRVGAFAVLAGLSFLQPLRGATQRAAVADLARPGRLESGFAALRIGINTGASAGPLVGAALVTLGWGALHAGTTLVFAASFVAALGLPREARREASSDTAARAGIVSILRSRSMATLFAATVLAWLVYQGFETVLPVTLTAEHGLTPAAWGLVFAVNPVLTVALQLRVTARSAGVSMQRKLTYALGLMSLPLLLVPFVGALLPAIVVIVLCVTLGEMLWAPASETIFAELAPAGGRGTALGLATSASWLGTALGPATALQMGAAAGELAMWALVAAFAAGSALLYAAAGRAQRVAPTSAPPATTSSATRTRRFPTTSLRPRKSAANTTVQSTPVPTSGATTVTRPRSSASSSVACASAVTTPEAAYGASDERSRGTGRG